jgi:pimeloyl-ACP methyl ester carboxylesterase
MKYFVAPGEDRCLDAATRRDLRGSFVELSDGVTHYELTGPGDGELAVLIGGLTVPLFFWDSFAAELRDRGIRTLAYSGYGRGYSDRVHTRYDDALFVRQLAELLAALDLTQPTHLVSGSMGALIAMAYAGGHTDSTSTLTLAGPAGLNQSTASQQRLLRNDWVAGFVARRFGRRLLGRHQAANVGDQRSAEKLAAMTRDANRYQGSQHAVFDTLQNFPFSGRTELYRHTGALGIPTLLIWGADDQVTPIDGMDTARALLRPRECHVIDDCGHMIALERPRDMAGLLEPFITAHTERTGS